MPGGNIIEVLDSTVQTALTVGEVQDGETLVRSGTSVVGAATVAPSAHTHTLSEITDAGTAAAEDVGAFEAAGAVATHAGEADPHTGYQKESEKDAVSGYAGLNASSRVTKGADSLDDLIVDDATKGVVLKSGNAHYWRLSVSDAGVISASDLGTSKP